MENEAEARIKHFLKHLNYLNKFPATEPAFNNMARAYSRFVSVDPIEKSIVRQNGKETIPAGTVPAEWLVRTIEDSCEYMPMPVEARRIYCEVFPAADGKSPVNSRDSFNGR